MPAFVGLTGGIGAGKSTALSALERLGAPTLSTDSVVHELYQSDEVVRAVTARFGEDVAPEGVIDREALAGKAFATEADRSWLEGILWPRVGERIVTWREEMETRRPSPRAVVVEVPLLFESGMDSEFDATLAVIAPEELREQRASSRGHASVDERNARQLPQREKAERATHVVLNDGTPEQLERKLSAVLDMLDA